MSKSLTALAVALSGLILLPRIAIGLVLGAVTGICAAAERRVPGSGDIVAAMIGVGVAAALFGLASSLPA